MGKNLLNHIIYWFLANTDVGPNKGTQISQIRTDHSMLMLDHINLCKSVRSV